MKKTFKRLAAVAMAAVMTMGLSVAAMAGQSTDGMADGTAYLNVNNSAWGAFDAEWTSAAITGNGQYTVSVVATEAQDLAQFNALEILNGETVFGYTYTVTVDSIKINGTAIELQGASYTCSADGSGVTTRVNLYNEWNTPDPTATAGTDAHLDCRVATGDVASATAKLLSADNLTGMTSMEVTFTVAGLPEGGGEGDEEDDNNGGSTPKTGDMTTVLPIALVAVAAMAAVVAMRKKAVNE